jgi:hypothetical protein
MSFTPTFSVNLRFSTVLEVNAVGVDIVLQEYLTEMQSDITAQAGFKTDTQHFCISSEIASNFPQLWEKANLFFMDFLLYI